MISPEVVEYLTPFLLGAAGVILMLPVTISLYRRFLSKPIAQKTKSTFVEAANDPSFVEPLKETLLWRELSGDTALTVQMATSRIDSIPNSIGEVVDQRLESATKVMGNHVSQVVEGAVAHIQGRINEVESKLASRRGFADPSSSQEKSVESRKVNQIVNTIEEAVAGPTWEAKVREVSELLEAVGQTDLAEWLEENPGKIATVERKIRSNPRLAKLVSDFQQRHSGRGAPGGSVVDL